MANVDRPDGFRPVWDGSNPPKVNSRNNHVWAASQTTAVNDPLSMDSAGRAILASITSAFLIGMCAKAVTSSTVGDPALVYDDPEQEFEGQCDGTPGLAAPYTCRTSTACYDLKGTTGVFEINDAASTYDIVKVVGFPDMASGDNDPTLINPRVKFLIEKHLYRAQSAHS